jgi:hypothetical protein
LLSAALCIVDAVSQPDNREGGAIVVHHSPSQPDPATEPTDPSDRPIGIDRLDADLLNGGSGQTASPNEPPNQGSDPAVDDDLLHGGSGEPESG